VSRSIVAPKLLPAADVRCAAFQRPSESGVLGHEHQPVRLGRCRHERVRGLLSTALANRLDWLVWPKAIDAEVGVVEDEARSADNGAWHRGKTTALRLVRDRPNLALGDAGHDELKLAFVAEPSDLIEQLIVFADLVEDHRVERSAKRPRSYVGCLIRGHDASVASRADEDETTGGSCPGRIVVGVSA
jgi:hypothetical protein